MKRTLSSFFALALIVLSGNLAYGQRTLGGTSVDLDDNAGNHAFLTTLGSSIGLNATSAAPNIGALLDLNSTTKGLLLPRMNAAQEAGVSLVAGMTLFNTSTQVMEYYNGISWVSVNSGWSLGGNSGTNSAINYIGTNDAQDFVIRTSATERMRIFAGGNLALTSTPGTAILIAGPAATSINANGTIQTTGTVTGGTVNSSGNLTVTGTSKLGSTSTPIKGVYKLTQTAFGVVVPANSGFTFGYGGFFGTAGFSPVPGIGDAIVVTADPGVFPSGLTWSAILNGADNVLINIVNGTGAPIAVGAGNLYFTAIKY